MCITEETPEENETADEGCEQHLFAVFHPNFRIFFKISHQHTADEHTELLLIIPPDHAWRELDSVSIRSLDKAPFVARQTDSQTRIWLATAGNISQSVATDFGKY